MALTRPEIVAAALEILDAYGLGDLTMRRIAEHLGVRVGALYHHVANKQSLLAALADEVLADLARPTGTPTEVVAAWAGEFRRALLAHRDGAEVVASVLSMRLTDTSPVAHLTACLTACEGVDDPRSTASTVVHLVLGHVLDEQGHAQLVGLGVVPPDDTDHEAQFAASVRLLTRGLER
ncbi:TetR family transcriptional regulator BioQ [Mariniluteicoccus endophyticus]